MFSRVVGERESGREGERDVEGLGQPPIIKAIIEDILPRKGRN